MLIGICVFLITGGAAQLHSVTTNDISSLSCLLEEKNNQCAVNKDPEFEHNISLLSPQLVKEFNKLNGGIVKAVEEQNFKNLTEDVISTIPAGIMILLPICHLSTLNGTTLSSLILQWKNNQVVLKHLVKAFLHSSFIETFSGMLQSFEFSEDDLRWIAEEASFSGVKEAKNIVGKLPLLFYSPPEAIIHYRKPEKFFFLTVWTNRDDFTSVSSCKTTLRFWTYSMIINNCPEPLPKWNNLYLERWGLLLTEATTDELNKLSKDSLGDLSILFKFNFPSIQLRSLFDKFYGDKMLTQSDFNLFSKAIVQLLPSQLARFPLEMKNIDELNLDSGSISNAQQVLEFLRAGKFNKNESGNLNYPLSRLVHALPLRSFIEHFGNGNIDENDAFAIQSELLTKSQMFSMSHKLDLFNFSSDKIYKCSSFIKVLPVRDIIFNHSASHVSLHLLSYIEPYNIPQVYSVLNRLWSELGSVSVFRKILQNKDAQNLLEYIPSKYIFQSADKLFGIIDVSDQKKFPDIFVSMLSKRFKEVEHNFHFHNYNESFAYLYSSLTCDDVSSLDPYDFIIVISNFNNNLKKAEKLFPKKLQHCCINKLLELLKLKSILTRNPGNVNRLSLLNEAEIDAIGGYILSALPISTIKHSRHSRSIIKSIGRLSATELLSAAPLVHLKQLASIAVKSIYPYERIRFSLFDLGNLTLFLEKKYIMQVNKEYFKLFLESDYIDHRLCVDKSTRSTWYELIKKIFGLPEKWTYQTLITLGDFLIVVPLLELDKIEDQAWIYAADVIKTKYNDKYEISAKHKFYEACLNQLSHDEQTLFMTDLKNLIASLVEAAQLQLNTVVSTETLVGKKVTQNNTNVFSFIESNKEIKLLFPLTRLTIDNITSYQEPHSVQNNDSTKLNNVTLIKNVSEEIDRNTTLEPTTSTIEVSTIDHIENMQNTQQKFSFSTENILITIYDEVVNNSDVTSTIIDDTSTNKTSFTLVLPSTINPVMDFHQTAPKDDTKQYDTDIFQTKQTESQDTDTTTIDETFSKEPSFDVLSSTISPIMELNHSASKHQTTNHYVTDFLQRKQNGSQHIDATTIDDAPTKIPSSIILSSTTDPSMEFNHTASKHPTTKQYLTDFSQTKHNGYQYTDATTIDDAPAKLPSSVIISSTTGPFMELNHTTSKHPTTKHYVTDFFQTEQNGSQHIDATTIDDAPAKIPSSIILSSTTDPLMEFNHTASKHPTTKYYVIDFPQTKQNGSQYTDATIDDAPAKIPSSIILSSTSTTGPLMEFNRTASKHPKTKQYVTDFSQTKQNGSKYTAIDETPAKIPSYGVLSSTIGQFSHTSSKHETTEQYVTNSFHTKQNRTQYNDSNSHQTETSQYENNTHYSTLDNTRDIDYHVGPSMSASSFEKAMLKNTTKNYSVNKITTLVPDNTTLTHDIGSSTYNETIEYKKTTHVQSENSLSVLTSNTLFYPDGSDFIDLNISSTTSVNGTKSLVTNISPETSSLLHHPTTPNSQAIEFQANTFQPFKMYASTEKANYSLSLNNESKISKTVVDLLKMNKGDTQTEFLDNRLYSNTLINNNKINRKSVIIPGESNFTENLAFKSPFQKYKPMEIIPIKPITKRSVVKWSCDALKIVGKSTEIILNESVVASLDDNDLFNCIDLFAEMDLSKNVQSLIWSRISLDNFVLGGKLVSACTMSDINGTYFSINIPWTMEKIYLLGKYNSDLTVRQHITQEIWKNANKPFTLELVASLGSLICELPYISSEVIEPKVFFKASVLLGRSLYCNHSCLSTLSNIAMHKDAFGDPTTWNSGVVHDLGVIISGLNTSSWKTLVLKNQEALGGLSEAAFDCLTYKHVKILGKLNPDTLPLEISMRFLEYDTQSKLTSYDFFGTNTSSFEETSLGTSCSSCLNVLFLCILVNLICKVFFL